MVKISILAQTFLLAGAKTFLLAGEYDRTKVAPGKEVIYSRAPDMMDKNMIFYRGGKKTSTPRKEAFDETTGHQKLHYDLNRGQCDGCKQDFVYSPLHHWAADSVRDCKSSSNPQHWKWRHHCRDCGRNMCNDCAPKLMDEPHRRCVDTGSNDYNINMCKNIRHFGKKRAKLIQGWVDDSDVTHPCYYGEDAAELFQIAAAGEDAAELMQSWDQFHMSVRKPRVEQIQSWVDAGEVDEGPWLPTKKGQRA